MAMRGVIERVAAWPWPLPAVLVWLAGWGWFLVLRGLGLGVVVSALLATGVGVLASHWGGTRWRRLFMALGFPLSWGFTAGLAGVPPWVWLLPAGVFLLLYPPGAWRDAPVFPTPLDAFEGLREVLPLLPASRLLDAGCGAGDGLRAFERAYPDVRLEGVERSWPLRILAAWRCPGARVFQGDMWALDWGRYDLVYLFQRPETMADAWAKAARELAPGAWLASLEFEVPDRAPNLRWTCPDGRPLWLYQQPGALAL